MIKVGDCGCAESDMDNNNRTRSSKRKLATEARSATRINDKRTKIVQRTSTITAVGTSSAFTFGLPNTFSRPKRDTTKVVFGGMTTRSLNKRVTGLSGSTKDVPASILGSSITSRPRAHTSNAVLGAINKAAPADTLDRPSTISPSPASSSLSYLSRRSRLRMTPPECRELENHVPHQGVQLRHRFGSSNRSYCRPRRNAPLPSETVTSSISTTPDKKQTSIYTPD